MASDLTDSLTEDLTDGLTWYRGSSVGIRRAGLDVYIDPLGSEDQGHADFILLTHPHYDNFSEEGIERLRTRETVVIAPTSMKKQLSDADHFLRPGDMLQLDGLDVLAVPAYNVQKPFHPPEAGWLGYVFTLGERTYYHAGDTDFIDAMCSVSCDVALLPVDGRYTMDAEAAARAAMACGATVVVPIRWGEGSSAGEVEALSRRPGVRVQLLEPSA